MSKDIVETRVIMVASAVRPVKRLARIFKLDPFFNGTGGNADRHPCGNHIARCNMKRRFARLRNQIECRMDAVVGGQT